MTVRPLAQDSAPTGDQHLCPDLALSLLAAFDLAPAVVPRPALTDAAMTSHVPRLSVLAPRREAQARGPPVSA